MRLRKARFVMFLGTMLALIAGGYVTFERMKEGQSPGTSAATCAAESKVHRAAFLVDLTKPLDGAHVRLPADLLYNAAIDLQPGTELAVYALVSRPEAPRILIGQVCKTVDLAPLRLAQSKAKHRGAGDCDVPAGVPARLRANAREFCRQIDMLAHRVEAIVLDDFRGGRHSPLVEALEMTARDFGDVPGRLYVFSDLHQHAAWFSHFERPLHEWEYEQMAAAWAVQPFGRPLRGFPPGTTVRIHYLPRMGTTEQEDRRTAHKRFWEGYFRDAEVVFDDQPAVTEFVPMPLREEEVPTAAQLAGYELERLREVAERLDRDRKKLEDIRHAITAEREQLDAKRRELAEQERRLQHAGSLTVDAAVAREQQITGVAVRAGGGLLDEDGSRERAGAAAVREAGSSAGDGVGGS